MLRELILKNRTYRRFDESHRVEIGTLRELVDLARLSASAANLQPLKYIISCSPETNSRIFPTLGWAAYLEDWPGPAEGERPAAYIIVLVDTEISSSYFEYDAGIAIQSILLGATERGLGGCIIASINREKLRKVLQIPDRFDILLVLAIGKPAERVIIEEITRQQDIKYWRDEQGIHHVPKRRLEDIIIREFS